MGARDGDGAAQALTAAQYGIWLGQQIDPASPAYWTAEAVELSGELDEAAFEAALRQAIGECDALHYVYASDGRQVWQTCLPRQWTMARHDVPPHALDAWMQADLLASADLAAGPLFATALLRMAPQRALWYLRVHHIALDGFGYALLMERVASLYSALSAGSVAPAPRAAALAPVLAEDAAYLASPDYARDQAFWCARMQHAPAPPLLAPARAVAHGVRRQRGALPAGTFEAWQQAAQAAGADWGAWLIAAIGAWIGQQTGAAHVSLGLPVMGRLGSAALGVPCMKMNIVPVLLRVDSQAPLAALARAAARELRAVRPHQRYRYEQLKQALGMRGGARRLFGAVVNLMPFDRPLRFGALDTRAIPVAAGPVEDLSITVAPNAHGVRLDFDANPDAYDAATLAQLHASLVAALTALLAAPHQALTQALGTPAQALLPAAPLPAPPEGVLAALVRHARATPQRTAIEQDGAQLTYAQLLDQVQALAAHLRAHGATEGARVVLLLPRAPGTIVALLAVLWAGAGYVPLDPDGPPLRIQTVLQDAAPTLVVTLRAHAGLAPGLPVMFLDDAAAAAAVGVAPLSEPVPMPADALAYVIYTSGSTGRPNGVMIGRDALAHFVAGAASRYAIVADDRVLQFAPLHFDASVEEIYLALCSGATLVLRNDAMLESLPAFAEALAERRISVLDLPTAFWHELAYCFSEGQAALPDSVRLVIIGGEAALAERVARWRSSVAPSVVLLNTYGPTEATVICTSAVLAGPDALTWQGDAVPIGGPLGGVGIAVVDECLRPVGLGREGELCLTGGALARGYLGQEALTAERFIRLDALPGAPRAYRTGDRVVLGQDGRLRYLGRLDGEIKLSGQRIDPLEIEAALLQHGQVREAAVVVAKDSKRLSAFIVASGPAPATPALRSFLGERLAPAAIPACFITLAALPRNHNGKIDRAALRQHAAQVAPAPQQAASALELTVMAVWREVLGVDSVSLDDDFFALGGMSLQAIQVANRLGIALQREVAVSALFTHPTVAALALALERLSGHAPPADAAGAAGAEYAPLLTIQRGSGPALFCIHPAEGLSWCYMGLARQLPQVPIYGLQARGISGAAPGHIDELVNDYLALIRAAQPHGPYRLLGWSSGGGVAHALAVQLKAAGEQVTLVAMMDAYPSDIWEGKPEAEERDALVALLDVIGASPLAADGTALERDALLARFRQPGSTLAGASDAHIARMTGTALHSMRLYRGLRHRRYDGDVLFFHASQRSADAPDWQGWAPYVGGRLERIDIDSSHSTMSRPAPLAHIGRVLAQRLAFDQGA